ncbi:golgin subfamily A member 6-like protein 7 [Archocentrus centrarchus]|uniref:golgin subfamily A member 6-like protein 7 n=1 Tax=Archocentrus centrarchus TaxID=63155 RepID=UPI0011EA2318|nr:golgin subfamily A member 6-like protein 7 [Archocentrus centrarchus]
MNEEVLVKEKDFNSGQERHLLEAQQLTAGLHRQERHFSRREIHTPSCTCLQACECLTTEPRVSQESVSKQQDGDSDTEEEENQLLKDKHEHLAAELFCLREKCQKRRSAMQKFQDKLEEVQEVLHSNGEQIQKLSRTVIQKNKETEENLKIIEDLKKEQRELRKQLGTRQEDEFLAALQFQEESNTLTEAQNMDEKDKKHQDKRPHQTQKTKRSWWCDCAKVLRKGVKLGSIILGLLFFGVHLRHSRS